MNAATGARLGDLGARLAREVDRLRAEGADPANPFRGLYIDEPDVATALDETGAGPWAGLSERRLEAMRILFALDRLDVEILLAAAAPDLDQRYERIYAFLQDDVVRKRPTVGLLVRLLSDLAGEAVVRARFHPEAPLVRSGLLTLDAIDAPLLATAVRSDERVVAHLLGIDALDARLLDHTAFEPAPLAMPFADEAAGLVLRAAVSATAAIALRGAMSVGKRDAARLFARSTGLALLIVDVQALLACPACTPPAAIRLVLRDALFLSVRRLLVARGQALGRGRPGGGDAAVIRSRARAGADPRAARRHSGLGAAAGRRRPSAPAGHDRGADGSGARDPLALRARRRHRRGVRCSDPRCGGRISAFDPPDRGRCARCPVAGVESTAPRPFARATCTPAAAPSRDGAWPRSAREVDPAADWSAPRAARGLRAAATRAVRDVPTPRPRARGVGLRQAAERRQGRHRALRRHLGDRQDDGRRGRSRASCSLALFRIDLSGIVSKWIGETEKNLDRVFEAAWDSNAILFFDEADALFGKRSEVKDSHDRYANLEISYLLQKMESYDGLAILATNMRQQIDDAFLRRLTFNVVFPLPEEHERARIWAAVWPDGAAARRRRRLRSLARIRLAGGQHQERGARGAHLAAAERPSRSRSTISCTGCDASTRSSASRSAGRGRPVRPTRPATSDQMEVVLAAERRHVDRPRDGARARRRPPRACTTRGGSR